MNVKAGGQTWCGLTWVQGECWRWSVAVGAPTPGCLGRGSSACRCLRVRRHRVRSAESPGWAAARRWRIRKRVILSVCVYLPISLLHNTLFHVCLWITLTIYVVLLHHHVWCVCTFCGASCSGTSQSSSEAAGSCMPSNCLSKPMATDSAELDWRKEGELRTHKRGQKGL